MPKMKVRKTLLKRFKVTKNGKVLRGKQMSGHRKFHKTKRQIRSHRKTTALNGQQARIIKKLIQ